VTLNFYSTRAYKYVRDTFELALPHPSIVSSWYKTTDGEPGFIKESFDGLTRHAQKQQQAGHQMLWKQSVRQVTMMDVANLLASVFYWTNSTHCL